MEELNSLRIKIDETDKRIVVLLNERFENVKKIGSLKTDANIPIEDVSREEEILNNLKSSSRPEYFKCIANVYKEIFRQSRALEKE